MVALHLLGQGQLPFLMMAVQRIMQAVFGFPSLTKVMRAHLSHAASLVLTAAILCPGVDLSTMRIM